MTVSAFSFRDSATTPAVIACLDGTARSREVAEAAAGYAQWFGRPLVFYHAIEFDRSRATPPDPLEWHFKRNAMRENLESLQACLPNPAMQPEIQIEGGSWQAALFERNLARPAPMIVVGASRQQDSGVLTRSLLELGAQHILVVPRGYRTLGTPRLRIAIPVDGSDFAEAALAQAIDIARTVPAELLLVHVMSSRGVEKFGLPGSSDLALQKQVEEHNEKAACTFLEATLRRLQNLGLAARSQCLKGDPRTRLEEFIAQETPDMVIMSTRGQGFNSCAQLPLGSTASYLLDRLSAPTILVGSGKDAVRPAVEPSIAHYRLLDNARGPLNSSPATA
ncbi:universal stress protein [Altererythrobacter sp. KTW20L]|uniref:universal stress protein n=1 Tax=Altererythrobacter sp. KTW20L TaxID=2942210 RepID=UPI0020BED311|nr:universal stress protein [Altererythrobacter sp. KTW20L]MCL6251236.1 universal stress protein [Altererythrobacter sp. KTW20L]